MEDSLKIIFLLIAIIILSFAGAIIGAFVGALMLPLKILEGRVGTGEADPIILTDSEQDQI